jgi:hypothetical protein
VAQELKQKSVHEAVETERELGRGRTAARSSQVVDYVFYLIYGVILLQFLLKLMGARPGNGFVQSLTPFPGHCSHRSSALWQLHRLVQFRSSCLTCSHWRFILRFISPLTGYSD